MRLGSLAIAAALVVVPVSLQGCIASSGPDAQSASIGTATAAVTSAFVKLASGGTQHTCGITPAGQVKCWGTNTVGQLGDGTMTQRLTPVAVADPELTSGVSSIVAGNTFSCALLSTGTVKCWGSNTNGTLGDGTNTSSTIPVTVTGLTNVVGIAAGRYHACAITSLGTAKCWGGNNKGQLGNGLIVNSNVPVDVTGLTNVAAMDGGQFHTCALTTAGGVKCWGSNVEGALGDGTQIQRNTPVDVLTLTSGVIAIGIGFSHGCAVTTAGAAKCWGSDGYGELGDARSGTYSLTPVDVSGLTSGVADITAGASFTCAVTTAGAAKCWGKGGNGELGDGTPFKRLDSTTKRTTPVNVVGLGSGVATIIAGTYHTCAALTGGGLNCWGEGKDGQLGNGVLAVQTSPVSVLNWP